MENFTIFVGSLAPWHEHMSSNNSLFIPLTAKQYEAAKDFRSNILPAMIYQEQEEVACCERLSVKAKASCSRFGWHKT
ncbi:hypothetical protein Tco_0415403 [Tanacetum coccineum]